jgi:hypothetical protein
MSLEEYAAFETSQGDKLLRAGGVYWKQTRPFFYRPLLPYAELSHDTVRPPRRALLGGFQFALKQGKPSNSRLNLMMFPDTRGYTLESLERHKRKQVKAAAKEFEIRPLTNLREFTETAYPVYLSFYERTQYVYQAQRREREGFARWAETLFRFPKLMLLGAFRQGELSAVSISVQVGDTVVYEMVFPNETGLRLNVTSLLLHVLREAAAASSSVRQMFVGMYKFLGRTGIDDFYLVRGCQLVSKPSAFVVNPLARLFLRSCLPAQYAKLSGKLEPEMEPLAMVPPPTDSVLSGTEMEARLAN